MKTLYCIVGPTASGKTAVAIELAILLKGEIISADSRQIYKHFPIGTSVPLTEERKGIRHYFLEELEPEEEMNAGIFGKEARDVINNIFSRGFIPIMAGGSGLYIKSVIDGLFEGESKDEEIRKRLNKRLAEEGREKLYDELKSIDEETAEKMSPEYSRRVIRALEIYYTTGKKPSEIRKQKPEINFSSIQFGLMPEREYLYERINERVEKMINAGLIDEVVELRDSGLHWRRNNSLDTVGIKEVFRYLDGEYSYDKMVETIKQNTRKYAKRQITWFKKDKRINWIEIKRGDTVKEITGEIMDLIKQTKPDSR